MLRYGPVMLPTVRPSRSDLFLAGIVAVVALVEVLVPGWPTQDPSLPLALSAVAMGASLVWRRGAPLAVAAVVCSIGGLQAWLLGEPWDTGSALLIPLLAVYAVGAYAPLRLSVAGFGGTVLGQSLIDVTDSGDTDWLFITLVLGTAYAGGVVARRQRALIHEVAAQAEELRRSRAVREAAVVADERARIARELHDVIAHCVTTMVVQAEAGHAWLARDPQRASDAFASVQATGRQALTELRRMLDLLREEEGTGLLPQPTMARLGRLVDDLRSVGLEVEVVTEGTPVDLPPGIDLSAYRIVQEALTNTLKHSDAQHATVRVSYREDALELAIDDDGRPRDVAAAASGHGLLGMRERVNLHGGELHAGPAPERGFGVRTRLPL